MTPASHYLPAWCPAGEGGTDRPGERFRFGPACATPAAAARVVKAEVRAARAALGFVVRLAPDGRKFILATYAFPTAARKVLRHFLDLEDALGEDYEGVE